MALGKDLSDKPVEHIDQTNESDGSFIDAAGATSAGAITSVKNRQSVVGPGRGKEQNATGEPLPVITITQGRRQSPLYPGNCGACAGRNCQLVTTTRTCEERGTTVKRKRG